MPEQRMQTNTPRFQLAHRGSKGSVCVPTNGGEQTFVSLAVGTGLVGFELDEVLEGCAVLLDAVVGHRRSS